MSLPPSVSRRRPRGSRASPSRDAPDAVPKPPAVPSGMTEICRLQRSEGRFCDMPTDALGDALAAYNILRAFSWQLRLSPATFAEFCTALGSSQPTPLMDEIHICVLRTLAEDEIRRSRTARVLPLDQMDAVTWPEYVWEWLQLMGSPLTKLRWSQPAPAAPPRPPSSAPSHPGKQQAEVCNGEAAPALPPQGSDAAATSADQTEAATAAGPIGSQPPSQLEPVSQASSPSSQKQAQTPLSPLQPPPAPDDQQLPQQLPDGGAPPGEQEQGARQPEGGNRQEKLPWQLGQAGTDPPALQEMITRRVPPKQQFPVEYNSLPMTDKAIILAQLCDNLVDLRTIRNEIERREAEGQWVAGFRGEGGIFPMRSLEERARRNNPETDENGQPVATASGDGNSDLCVLCTQGGSLLCCDGCPAAYHVRCIGETARSLPEGEWLCPECSLGGRGEAAGLRIPMAGLDVERAPHWAAYSALWWGPHGQTANGLIGSEADDSLGDRLTCAAGPDKLAAAKALRKPRADERPPKSTLESIADGPIIPGAHEATAEGFLNRYRNAWTAAITATRGWVEDAIKRKGKPLPGTSTHIQLSELPIPLPISRFQWPLTAGKGSKGGEKCGKCRHCTIPSLKKPCINPIKSLPEGGPEPSDTSSKLPSLANFLIKAERELWGLLEGPWAGGQGMAYRRAWGHQVRSATSASQLAAAAEVLEMALRRIALPPTWDALQKPPSRSALNPGLGHKWVASNPAPNDKRPPGRPAGLASEPQRKSLGRPRKSVGAAAASAGPASGPVKKRRKQQESDSEPDDFSEPESDASGSKKRIPGVIYNIDQPALVPSLGWRGRVEGAGTAARLGLALRTLDVQISWEGLKRPSPDSGVPFASLEIVFKRPASSGQGSEYQLHRMEEVPPASQPVSQPLQPPKPLGRPKSAGAESAKVGMLGKGKAQDKAPSLMGLLRGIAPPKSSSPAPGTPLAPLPAAWPQALIQPPPQHSLEGQWMHESKLPLWLIKAFEERSRREAALEAARAAREAAREAARGAVLSERQAANQAAAAAAAHAGDACAVCGLSSGEVPEKDHFWIACDSCNKWYHGDCIGMTEEQNNDIGDHESWECPDCATSRIDRRSAAILKARQRRMTQGRTTGIRLTPEQHEKAKTKPGDEGQKKQRKKERLAQAGEASGADSAVMPGSKSKRPRKSKGKENEGEGPKLYCTCQQPDDHSRPFIQCDGCEEWYHPECVGATLADAASQEQWTCPECIGNLRRRKTKFTAPTSPQQLRMGARTHPASLGNAVPEEEGGEGRRRRKKVFPGDEDTAAGPASGPSAKGSGGKQGAEDWQSTVLQVLDAAMTYPGALPFTSPVSEEQAPGYRAVVKRPMDLGTLRNRVARGKCPNALAALSDIRLIWKNCRSFNAEGSEIAVMCTDAAKWVRRLWNQMGLPKKEKAGPKAPSNAEAEPAAGNSSKSSRRAQKAAAAAAANGGPQPEELPEEAVREAALGIRKRKRRDRDGQGPADAADEDAAAEGGLPRRKGRRESGQDQRWVSMNGGEEGMAEGRTERKANLRVKLKGLHAGSSPRLPRPEAQPGAGPSAAEPEPVDVGKQLATAHKVMKQVLKLKCSATFAVPVTEERAPNYSSVIKEPRDLGTISGKLGSSDGYSSLGELLADVALVWKNCRIFNAAGSEINGLCDETEAAFAQRWQQAGLPTSKSGKPRAEARRRKPHPADGADFTRPTRRTAAQAGNDDPAAASGGGDEVGGGRGKKAGRRASQEAGGDAEAMPSKHPEGRGHPKGPKRMRSLSELPSEPEPAGAKKRARAADAGLVGQLEGPLETALGVVKGLMRVKAAAPFTRPVLESQVPGYHKAVKRPMDLGTVRDSLQDGQYDSLGAVWSDLQQIWRNCRAFNTKGSLVASMGEQAAAILQDRWAAAGLSSPDRHSKGRPSASQASPAPSKPPQKQPSKRGPAPEMVPERPTRRGRSDPNQQLESLETEGKASSGGKTLGGRPSLGLSEKSRQSGKPPLAPRRSSSRTLAREPEALGSGILEDNPSKPRKRKGKDPDMPDLSAFIEYRRSTRHGAADPSPSESKPVKKGR
ncbi:hypothetical protein WJX84_004562 [Apatococcus fuscideae]|uniref:Uncharacterized protein n=1 Tax=Apatococcus fuscideae TaxID=2026836 RepID=A0AAW1THJ3_9CHLO